MKKLICLIFTFTIILYVIPLKAEIISEHPGKCNICHYKEHVLSWKKDEPVCVRCHNIEPEKCARYNHIWFCYDCHHLMSRECSRR